MGNVISAKILEAMHINTFGINRSEIMMRHAWPADPLASENFVCLETTKEERNFFQRCKTTSSL
jgi:hypothetical protein